MVYNLSIYNSQQPSDVGFQSDLAPYASESRKLQRGGVNRNACVHFVHLCQQFQCHFQQTADGRWCRTTTILHSTTSARTWGTFGNKTTTKSGILGGMQGAPPAPAADRFAKWDSEPDLSIVTSTLGMQIPSYSIWDFRGFKGDLRLLRFIDAKFMTACSFTMILMLIIEIRAVMICMTSSELLLLWVLIIETRDTFSEYAVSDQCLYFAFSGELGGLWSPAFVVHYAFLQTSSKMQDDDKRSAFGLRMIPKSVQGNFLFEFHPNNFWLPVRLVLPFRLDKRGAPCQIVIPMLLILLMIFSKQMIVSCWNGTTGWRGCPALMRRKSWLSMLLLHGIVHAHVCVCPYALTQLPKMWHGLRPIEGESSYYVLLQIFLCRRCFALFSSYLK